MTLHRLLLREILVPLVLALAVTTQLLIAVQMLQLGGILFGAAFDVGDVLRVAAYLTPQFAAMALPLAFLFAVMLGIGRLAEDGEVVALRTLGRRPETLYVVPLALALILGAGCSLIAWYGEPWGAGGVRRQLNEVIKRNIAGHVQPGVLFDEVPGFTVLVTSISADGAWHHVFLSDESGSDGALVILANEGRLESDGADESLRLVLHDGEVHREGTKGSNDRVRFGHATLSLGVESLLRRQNLFTRPIYEFPSSRLGREAAAALAGGDVVSSRRARLLMGRRAAAGEACLVFALLSVPLAASRRGGRGRALAAVAAIFAVYFVLQGWAIGAAESGTIPVALAVQLPALVLAAAAAMASRSLRTDAGMA